MEYGAKPRSQYDPNMVFPALSAPFISCYIGSDLENGVHIGNTYLQQQDGTYDPKFIKSIQVWRTVPDHSSSIFSALLAYIRAMNTSDTLTPEERDRYGKNAEKELEKKQKEAKEARLNAPKELEEKLKGMTDRYLHSVNRGGVRANIELSLIGDISLMTWLYNYSVSQKLRPNLRLQYGIMAGNGQRLRVSPVYEGIIMSAKIQNFWDLSLSVVFTPSKAIGWNPEAFNKIFKDPTGRKENAGKTTNMPSRPYKEGQQVISVNEKTRRYSNVVRRIAEGLEWNIGHIEPTTLMPEGVLITVDGFENGPLDYIQEHFCGIVDQKDGNGKTVKAGAISEREHLMGYTAYFDYDENKKSAFYYVPTKALTRRILDTTKVYCYQVSGSSDTEDHSFSSEVLEFSINPIDLKTTLFNVEKGDGKGETNLPVVDNSKKEVGDITYTSETNVTTAGAATGKKISKGSAQNLTNRNTFGSNTKYALDAYEANQEFIVANTWTSQLKATMRILYDESVRLLQVIYVSVILPINDSLSVQGEVNTKKVIHPCSGLYRILGIEDNINGGSATTTLSLIRVPATQQEVNQMTEMLEANKKQVEKERKEQESRRSQQAKKDSKPKDKK